MTYEEYVEKIVRECWARRDVENCKHCMRYKEQCDEAMAYDKLRGKKK